MLQWWRRDLRLGIFMLSLWTAMGAVGFAWIEGWSLADGFYMAVITISTVGFGEVHPLSPSGRLFASFLIVGGLATAIYTFTRLGRDERKDPGRRRTRPHGSRREPARDRASTHGLSLEK